MDAIIIVIIAYPQISYYKPVFYRFKVFVQSFVSLSMEIEPASNSRIDGCDSINNEVKV